MYEQEIAELLNIDPAHGFQEAAIETAIALMRAAEPKSVEAERAYCARGVESMFATFTSEESVEMLLRARAAARAPLQAELARWYESSREASKRERELHARLADAEAQLAHAHKVEKHLRDEAVELRRQLEKK